MFCLLLRVVGIVFLLNDAQGIYEQVPNTRACTKLYVAEYSSASMTIEIVQETRPSFYH